MIVDHRDYRLNPGKQAEFEDRDGELRKTLTGQKGLVGHALLHFHEVTTRYVTLDIWESPDALNAFLNSGAAQAVIDAPEGMYRQPAEVETYELIDEGKGNGQGTFTIHLQANAAEGQEAEVERRYKDINQAAKNQPGCVSRQLLKSQKDAGKYLLIERWESPQARRTFFDSPAHKELNQKQPIIQVLSARAVAENSELISAW